MNLHRLGLVGVLTGTLVVVAPAAGATTKVIKSTAKAPAGYRCARERRHGKIVKVCVRRAVAAPVVSAPSTSPPPVTSAPEPDPLPAPVPVPDPAPPVSVSAPPVSGGDAPPPRPPANVVQATTGLSLWPQASWSVDTFLRTLTITQGDAVPAATCGAGAATCWAYTATISDTGLFFSTYPWLQPNGEPGAWIDQAVGGPMSATAVFAFYASTVPEAALVPKGIVWGRGVDMVPRSQWPGLAFRDPTVFATASGDPTAWMVSSVADYTTWCGEHWHAQWPGTDGHGPDDGNIVGLQCYSGG
jgi:hypothetical protein